MRVGGGKAKGGIFERECCKKLSLWLSDGKRDDLFWRSAMSGGRATVRWKNKELNYAQAGDICAIDPLGHKLTSRFVIECKHVKHLQLHTAVAQFGGDLYKFWDKLCSQAKHVRREPMLLAKQNQQPVLLITSPEGEKDIRVNRMPGPRAYLMFPRKPTAVVFLFEHLLEFPCPL